MTTIRHMALDIEGFMSTAKYPRQYKHMFKHDDGRTMTAEEARAELFRQLRMGRKLIPMGPCEGFDFENGCPGHETAANHPSTRTNR